jgi:very-short-patch-repair endonuclease
LSIPGLKRPNKKATKRASLKATKQVYRSKTKTTNSTKTKGISPGVKKRRRFRVPEPSFIEIRLASAMKLLGLPYLSQYKVKRRVRGSYYLDFAFPDVKLAVECDGKDYHSTTIQIRNDIKRQQELELMGWQFVRFTGAAINKDPRACAKEVSQRRESLLKM